MECIFNDDRETQHREHFRIDDLEIVHCTYDRGAISFSWGVYLLEQSHGCCKLPLLFPELFHALSNDQGIGSVVFIVSGTYFAPHRAKLLAERDQLFIIRCIGKLVDTSIPGCTFLFQMAQSIPAESSENVQLRDATPF